MRKRARSGKNGTSRAAARERKHRFADIYIANGENATQAYLEISPNVALNSAGTEGHKLLKDPEVHKLIEEKRAALRARYALTTDRVVQELARVSYFNPKRLVDRNGKPIPLHQLDDDTAAGLASVQISETEIRGRGKDKVVLTRLVKGRPFNKPSALEKSIKILRLYDRPPPPPDEAGHVADEREIARWLAFQLAKEAKAAERQEQQPKPKRKVSA